MKSSILALAVVLAGVLAVTGLTGCGGDDEEGETQLVTVTNEVGEVVVVEVPVANNNGNGQTGTGNTGAGDEDIPAGDRPELEAPSLTSPANNAIIDIAGGTIDVTFSWTRVDGALYYVLQVANGGDVREVQIEGTSHTFNLPRGVWRWQVAAVNGDLIEWTGTREVSIYTPGGWNPINL